jgi:hypothetical protein
MTHERRYQLECLLFTFATCVGMAWLVGDKLVRAVKDFRK